ncbi:tetraspanin-9 [Hyalella azteca]|uniref:Tetraspanin n=1 Tax=Hyalella azteca TaxID=294128 RepID=A0A8B7P0X1_HYAAZ|nr:tetraspanin-9 [Hyalella azteca]
MGCVTNCFLLLINLIVLMVGVAVIALSSYVLKTSVSYDVIFIENMTMLPMWTLIGGVFITILSLFGACGVIMKSTCMLRFYGSLVLLFVLMELVCGVLILVFREQAGDITKDRMFKALELYNDNDQTTQDAIDVAQHDLQCCGVNSYEDWFYILNENSVTPGCCKDNSPEFCYKNISALTQTQLQETLYTRGCYEALIDDLSQQLLALGILALVLVTVQLFCVIGAFCSASSIAKEKYLRLYQRAM